MHSNICWSDIFFKKSTLEGAKARALFIFWSNNISRNGHGTSSKIFTLFQLVFNLLSGEFVTFSDGNDRQRVLVRPERSSFCFK